MRGMKRVIFSAVNHHERSSGEPPTWTSDEAGATERRSYFENAQGEQWIASVAPERFRFTGGGIGWQTIDVKRPKYEQLLEQVAMIGIGGKPGFCGVALNVPEMMWLSSVVMGAVASQSPKAEPADLRGRLLQLKVTLQGVKPPIWRRLIVPAELTLDEVSAVILAAMGWENSHLHGFVIGRVHYGMADVDGMDDVQDERAYRLGDVAAVKSRFVYEYDFGDGWKHQVVVEKELMDSDGPPLRCLDGRRACPPEDCGGSWGYEELLAILANPRHPEHEERLEWVGGAIDPEAFDADEFSQRLAEMLEPPRKAKKKASKTKPRPARALRG
jgi:hypothetical protein